MQIAVHAGAHATDEDRIVNCLRKNQAPLARAGIGVPPPSTYRKMLRDILNSTTETGLSEGARDVVLDAIGDTQGLQRLALSNQGFFGTQKMAVSGTTLYPAAEARLGLLQRIFSGDEVSLFLGLRNPAMYLPALLDSTPFTSVDGLMRGEPPEGIRWSHLVARIRSAFPDMPVTVWCNEDTPMIWARIVRQMTGIDGSVAIDGEFALLSEIMTQPGFARFQEHLAAHPEMTDTQRQQAIAEFLETYADTDAIEVELDIPGWTEEIVDRLTDLYEADLAQIRQIEGVRMIAP